VSLQKSYMKRLAEKLQRGEGNMEFYVFDLLKARPHKYIRRFRKNGKWNYVYYEGNKKTNLTEDAIERLKKLADQGDADSKKLVDSIEDQKTKEDLIRKLAELGDKKAQAYLAEKKPESESEDLAAQLEASEPENTDNVRSEVDEEAQEYYDRDGEYAWARTSEISNIGEDLRGSARHRRNAYRDWETLEREGDTNLINRNYLERAMPTNFVSFLDQETTDGEEQVRILLMGHYALAKFPPSPATITQRELEAVNRQREAADMAPLSLEEAKKENVKAYFEAYQLLKKSFEENLNKPNLSYQNFSASIDGLRNFIKNRPAHELLMPYREQLRKYYNSLVRRGKTSPVEKARVFMRDSSTKHKEKPNPLSEQDKNRLKEVEKELDEVRNKLGEAVMGSQQYSREELQKMENRRNELSKERHEIQKRNPESSIFQLSVPTTLKLDKVREDAKDLFEGKSEKQIFSKETRQVKRGKTRAEERREMYVSEAIRRGDAGYRTPEKAISAFTDEMKMRGLQWGNSVTDDEREYHAVRAANAFSDLIETLDLPKQMASFNGRLGLAIGARGKSRAMAHYEPTTKVINLTRKNGVGSLAHEWGHFFDNILAEVHPDLKGKASFASEGMRKRRYYDPQKKDFVVAIRSDVPTNPVAQALSELDDAIHVFEARMYKERKEELKAKNIISSSEFRSHESIPRNEYWFKREETLARSFETYVAHKMKNQGKENTYLVGLKKTYGGVYPTETEIKAIEKSFDKLFDTFKNSDLLNKALDLLSRRSMQFYIEDKVFKSDKMVVSRKDLIEEHENLIDVLESPSHKDDIKEAKKQKKELKEYKKSFFIYDLIKAKPHKYLRKYRHNNKWVYIYHEGKGRQGRQIDEGALNALKKLAELGDAKAKNLVESMQEHHPEKIRALMKLAVLGDKRAQEHIKELGLQEIKLQKQDEIQVPDQPLDLIEEELAGEKRDKTLEQIKRSIDSKFNYLDSYRSSAAFQALDQAKIDKTKVFSAIKDQKSLKDMMTALHKEMRKIDKAHEGIQIQSETARRAGGYGNLIYNDAVKNLESAGILPAGYSGDHKRSDSGKLEMPRVDEFQKKVEEKRRKEEEALKREAADLFKNQSGNMNEILSYFNANLSQADKINLMKGLDKAFGKDFNFKKFERSIQGHPDVDVKIDNFVQSLIREGQRPGGSSEVPFFFTFIEKNTGRQITSASRSYVRKADGAAVWKNAFFRRAENKDLKKYAGMGKGLYTGVEKILKETIKNWPDDQKTNSQIVIGTCANDGFMDGYKGALVWAKHYFDFQTSDTADRWKARYSSRIDDYAQRAGIKPESVKAFKDKINKATYPYEFVKTGFIVTKEEALKMTNRTSFDFDFNEIFAQKGYCDLGEIIMIDTKITWSGVNKFAANDERSKHLNDLRTKLYDKQPVPKPERQQLVIDESLIQRPTATAERAPSGIAQRHIGYWTRGNRSIVMSPRRVQMFSRWPVEDQRDFLRNANLNFRAKQRLYTVMNRNRV
jgi:polyhydroxyalkanoate synthesis regulator phasin